MGYLVQFDDVRQVFGTVSSGINTWNGQIGDTKTAVEGLAALESFQGKGAEAAKAYFSEVHGALYLGIAAVLTDFLNKYILYQENYYDIDTNIHAKLRESVMEQGIREYNGSKAWMEEINGDIAGVLQSISDIAYIPQPAIGSVQYAYDSAVDYIEKLIPKVTDYESQVSGSDVAALRELIRDTRKAVQSYLNASVRHVSTYQSGDLANNDAVLAMAESFEVAAAYSEAHQSELEDACGHLEEIYAELQKEAEEEAAKERADAGIAQMIVGSLAVVAGVSAIVLTAGAATPFVVTAAVSGTCTCAYGLAEMSEGAQETYYGMNGDLESESFNPIRDTIFCGNQDAYSLWGTINMTVASLCVPISHGTAGLTGASAVKESVKIAAREFAVDQVIDYGAGIATDHVMDAIGSDSETLRVLVNSGLSTVANKAWDKAYSHTTQAEVEAVRWESYQSGKGLAGMMDEADAKSYEEYWKELNWKNKDNGFIGQMDEADAQAYNAYWNNLVRQEVDSGLKTEPDTAWFYSGLEDGEATAKSISSENSGVTLDSKLEDLGVRDEMPVLDYDDPDSINQANYDTWGDVSETYAERAKGEVHVLLKDNEFSDSSIWATKELPTLEANPDVTKVTVVDADTGQETVFVRGENGFVSEDGGENLSSWGKKAAGSNQTKSSGITQALDGLEVSSIAFTKEDVGETETASVQVNTKIQKDAMNDLLGRTSTAESGKSIYLKDASDAGDVLEESLERVKSGSIAEDFSGLENGEDITDGLDWSVQLKGILD